MMSGSGLTLTGQLGDVMQESAKTAMGYIRSKAHDFGIEHSVFKENELHVHLPAGATPKDGHECRDYTSNKFGFPSHKYAN